MPFKSAKQAAFMRAAANNSQFAAKVGIAPSTAKKFVADSNNKILKGKKK